ncbi:MAG: DMT family transporter, partial [Pseudomonadota bacterium]
MTTAVSPPTEPQAANPLFDNAYLLMTLTALFWAGNMTLGKAVAGHIPPISLACLRWTFAGLLLLTLAWPHLKRDLPMVRRHWPVMLLLGITGPGLFNTLQYVGLNFTSAING